ncbi:TonB-dependent receptor [Pacificimonas sp. WHA3]|uniref:TonB-dependent receptor n=1 Tax=Pacificimonas pallii TaxID=2827236 RepID=A0ABS6SG43_9SPHN|nr:TonB-dependent receptor [Pacificimonas pallii]MBV7257374.1 TonB-dependent receptor [Pacificimonas pallii]
MDKLSVVRKSRRSRSHVLLGSVMASILVAAPALAQTEESEAQSTDGAKAPLSSGTIVVTAQRRAQNPQDIGVAITTLGGETLASLGVTDSTDIDSQVPNLIIDPMAGSGTQPVVFLRGVGLNDFSLNNSGPVGLYFDDIYLSSFSSQNFLLFDLQRVEVLRGPQGTLYGKNTTGGAINYISNPPTDYLDGYVQGSIAEFGAYEIEGAVGGPIAEGVNARVAVARHFADGFFVNELTDRRSNGTDLWALRAFVELEPSPDARILLRFRADINDTPFSQYERYETIDPVTGGACSTGQSRAGECVDVLGYRDTTKRYRGNFNREESIDREVYGLSVKAEFALGDVDLTSITSYEEGQNLLPEDSDGSPLQLLAITVGADTDTFTQELRLSGETDRLNWIVGGYYLDERTRQNQSADLFRELRPLVASLAPATNPGGFDPFGAVLGTPVSFSRHKNQQDSQSLAVFARAEFALTDQLTVIGGLRYTKEEREFRSEAFFEEPTFRVPLYQADLAYSDDDISGNLAINYQPSRDLLLYASYSKGFKSGGFNGGFLFQAAELGPFESEQLHAYEAGAKWSLPGHIGYLNLASFYYDYSDLQVFTLVNTGNVPATILDNAANAEIYGAEAELFLNPVDSLNATFSLGYLESELVDFVSAGVSQAGNRLPRTPEITFSGAISYQADLSDDLFLRPSVNFTYTGHHFFLTENQPLAAQDAYWLVNGELTIGSDRGWQLAGFVKNLFDVEYNVNVNDLSDLGFHQVVVGAPRTFGVRARFDF